MIPGSSTDSTAAAQSHRCCAQEPVHSAAAPASAPDVPGDQSKSQPSVPRGAGTVFCEKTYKVKIDDETVWQVPTRLKYVKKVGSGAYGCVASFVDTTVFVREETNSDDGDSSRQQNSCSGSHCEGSTKNGQEVASTTNKKLAVKKIGDLFRDLIDAKRIYREIKILKELKHDNIINLVEILDPQTPDFDDIYLVSDLMDTDLHRVIYSRQPLTPEHHQYFLYQLLLGLSFLHQADIIHRDLKPSNVLVNLNCDIKICDFGLARGLNTHPPSAHQLSLHESGLCGSAARDSVVRTYSGNTRSSPHTWEEEKIAIAAGSGSSAATRLVRLAQQQQGAGGYDAAEQRHELDTRQDDDGDDMELTDYVVTRWYRPPEILISPFCYSKPVDLWSVGCIFAELLGRRALFAGKDHFDQLRRIVRIMGRPSTEEINKVANEGRGKHFNGSGGGKKTSSTKKRRSEAARRFIESLPNNQPYNLEELFPEAPPAALDLLTRFLAFDPANRITVQEALRHEYFEGLHSVEDEPRVTSPVDWSFDNFVPTKRLLQNKVYQEILSYHPEIVLRDFPLLPSRGIHISPATLPPYIRQPLSLLQQQRQAPAPAHTLCSSKSLHSFSSTTVPSSCASLRGSISRSSQLSSGTPRSSSTLVPPAVHVHPPASSGSSGQLLSSSDEDRSLSAASTAPPDENQEALSSAVLLDSYTVTRATSSAGLSAAHSLASGSSCYFGACASKKGKVENSSGKHHSSGSSHDSSNSNSANLLHAEASSYSLPSTHPSSSVVSSPPQTSCSVQSFPGLPPSVHTASSAAGLGGGVNVNTMMKQRDSGQHFCGDTSASQLLCCSSSPSYSVPTCASIASFASLPATLASSSSIAAYAPASCSVAPRVLHSNRSTAAARSEAPGSASAPPTAEQLTHKSHRVPDENGGQLQHGGDGLKQGPGHELASFDHSRRVQAQPQLLQNAAEGGGEGKRSSAVVYRARYHHAGHRAGHPHHSESSQLPQHPTCHGQRGASGSLGCSNSHVPNKSTQSIGGLLNAASQGLHCPGGCTRSASLPSTASELLAAAQQAVGSGIGLPPFGAPSQPGGSHRLVSCAGHNLEDPLDRHRHLHVDRLLQEGVHSNDSCLTKDGTSSGGGARCTSCCAEILTQPSSSKYSAFFNHPQAGHYDTNMCGGAADALISQALQRNELRCSGHRGCKDSHVRGVSCCGGPSSNTYSTVTHGGNGSGATSLSACRGGGDRILLAGERRAEGAVSRDEIDYGSRTTTRSSLCTDDGGFVADGHHETSSAALLQQFHNELQKQQLAHQEAAMQGEECRFIGAGGSGGRRESSVHAVPLPCFKPKSDDGSTLVMERGGRTGRGEMRNERERTREVGSDASLGSSAASGATDMPMDVSVGSDSEKKGGRIRAGSDVMTNVDYFLLRTQQRGNAAEEGGGTHAAFGLTEQQIRILRQQQQQLQGHLHQEQQQQQLQ